MAAGSKYQVVFHIKRLSIDVSSDRTQRRLDEYKVILDKYKVILDKFQGKLDKYQIVLDKNQFLLDKESVVYGQ